MITLLSFIIVLLGSLNWFFIGAFQYDIVAGFFGSQASLLSRLVYFLIGVFAFVLLTNALKNKGVIKITENPFKKLPHQNKNQNNSLEQQNDIQQQNEIDGTFIPSIKGDIKTDNLLNQTTPHTKEGFKDFDVTQYD